MKIMLNEKESLTVQTPFGELILSIDSNMVKVLLEGEQIKENFIAGGRISLDNGSEIAINTKVKSLSNKFQIAMSNGRNDIFFIVHESKKSRSEYIDVDDFLEYCNFEWFNEIKEYDYALLLEYIDHKGIVFEEDTLENYNYELLTNF